MLSGLRRVLRRDGLEGFVRRSVGKPAEQVAPLMRRGGDRLLRAADQFAIRVASAALTRSERDILARNGAFTNCHAGRRCFVIGNGPSLKSQDLNPLAQDITFAVSAFWKHPVVNTWQPTYYCVYDPLFFDGSTVMDAFFENLRARIRRSTFIVPLYARNTVKERGLLPLDRTHFVASVGPWCRGWTGRCDTTGIVDAAQSVAQLALMVAIQMGCSPIYLLGLDHDWLAHRGEDRHFYTGKGGLERHPEIKKTLAEWPYAELIESQLRLWQGYEMLNDVAQRRGSVIFNATDGGFLDVFPRVSFTESISRAVATAQSA
jgi:hypothetical protein